MVEHSGTIGTHDQNDLDFFEKIIYPHRRKFIASMIVNSFIFALILGTDLGIVLTTGLLLGTLPPELLIVGILAKLSPFLVLGFYLLVVVYSWLAFKALRYEFHEDVIEVHSGVLWKQHVIIPYEKITILAVERGPIDRMLGIADVQIITSSGAGANLSGASASLKGLMIWKEIHGWLVGVVKDKSLVEFEDEKENVMTEEEVLMMVLERIKILSQKIRNMKTNEST